MVSPETIRMVVLSVIEWGAFRYAKRNFAIVVFSWAVPCFSLFIACVKLCTNRSARLLVAGWNGAVVICLIPFIFKNIWNYAEVNCGPLSVTNCAGTLYRANKVRGRSMVWAMSLMAWFQLAVTSSGHPLWWETFDQGMVQQNPNGFFAKVLWAIPSCVVLICPLRSVEIDNQDSFLLVAQYPCQFWTTRCNFLPENFSPPTTVSKYILNPRK